VLCAKLEETVRRYVFSVVVLFLKYQPVALSQLNSDPVVKYGFIRLNL